MMTDPIADMICRMKNAQVARHHSVVIPASAIKQHIAHILVDKGYVKSITEAEDNGHPAFELELKYLDDEPVIQQLRRASTPGRRRYVKADEIPKVRNGLGLAILSTSKGVMGGEEARAKNVGGEVLLTVY